MTAEEFIAALETKQLLPGAMIEKLRQKTTSSSKPLTAKSLARFLIDKKHLTKQQAMTALTAGGEIASPTPPQESAAEKPGEPSGLDLPDLPLDSLQDLSSSSEWTLDEGGGFTEPTSTEPVSSQGKGKSKKKKKKQKPKGGNEWDSPLLLIGGGSLVLILLVGGVIAYILNSEGADKTLDAARDSMKEGSYGNGIASYERFIEKWPSNASFGAARVELAMARIRQTIESGNPSLALETATDELRAIADLEEFSVAPDDLSELLPRIARSLADKSEASKDPDKTQALLEEAKKALGMTNNTKYVPKSRRDKTELEGIFQTIERIDRRQESLADLQSTLATIQQAIADNDTQQAYESHHSLVQKHPSLITDVKLAEGLKKVSQAESKSIRFVEEPISATTKDSQNSILATLALANRRQAGSAPIQGVYCVQVSGVAYGLDSATGKLLWRRYTGPTLAPTYPLTVGNDLLLVEWQDTTGENSQQALLRVDAVTGKLKWRLLLDDQLAEPVVSRGHIFLAGSSGKLHVVDADSGTRTGYVQFAQSLRTPPVVSEQVGRLYLAGEHSSLYTLSTKDFSCTGVFYSQHPRGSIVAPPVIVLDKAIVIENDGMETCQLRLFALDSEGNIDKALESRRLEGRVIRQPHVDARRFMAITDRGQISVYEVSQGTDGEVLNLLANRSARGGSPYTRFGTLAKLDIWFAEKALTKYEVAPTGSRLSVRELNNDYNRSQFIAPLKVRDGVLLHVRSRRNRAGFTVTACNTKNGISFWQTDVAVPPAGNPLVKDSPIALLNADANGQVYLFDRAAIQSHIQDQALQAPKQSDPSQASVVYEHSTLFPSGAAMFSATGSEQLLFYRPSGQRPLAYAKLASKLACRPTAFAKGVIAPLSMGQVFYLDGAGKPLAAPFQPPLQPGRTKEWLPAGATDDEQLVISDGLEKVYLLEIQQGNAPVVVSVAETAVGPSPLTTGIAVLAGRAYAGTHSGLAVFLLPSLDAGDQITLGSSITWGPYRVGNHLVVRTKNNDLVAIDAKGAKVWQVAAPPTAFTGPPLEVSGGLIVATQAGIVLRIQLSDGSEAGKIDTRQPIAGGPVLLNKRVVVATRDGALLVVESP